MKLPRRSAEKHVQGLDLRGRRSLATPGRQLLEQMGRAFGTQLDAAIAQVSHPAPQAERFRLARRRGTVANPLHLAVEDEVKALIRLVLP